MKFQNTKCPNLNIQRFCEFCEFIIFMQSPWGPTKQIIIQGNRDYNLDGFNMDLYSNYYF